MIYIWGLDVHAGEPVAVTPIPISTGLAKDAVDAIFATNQSALVTLIGMPGRSYFCLQFETTNIEGCGMYTVERRHPAVDHESNRPEPSGAINFQTMARSSLGKNSLSGTKRAFLHVTINTGCCIGPILNIELWCISRVVGWALMTTTNQFS